jgi:hypothetical protein
LISDPNNYFRCREVYEWRPIPKWDLIEEHGSRFYDTQHDFSQHQINLNTYPLFDDQGNEVPIYDSNGEQIQRMLPVVNSEEPQCGVLMDLQNIQALFNPNSQLHVLEEDEDDLILPESQFIQVNAFPLTFLKTAGNIQATGVPHCFWPIIANINQMLHHDASDSNSEDSDNDSDHMPMDRIQQAVPTGGSSIVKPIASQFYNYIAHWTAAHAGQHYSQRGTVTAAVAGGFAEAGKDKNKASEVQEYCRQSLPFERFHNAISLEDCPSCCRAELIYSVDVQELQDRSGRQVYLYIYAALPNQ